MPSPQQRDDDPGVDVTRGWQRSAFRALDDFGGRAIRCELDPASAAMLDVQVDPYAMRVCTARPTSPERCLPSPLFRALLFRRLLMPCMPLPLAPAACRCRPAWTREAGQGGWRRGRWKMAAPGSNELRLRALLARRATWRAAPAVRPRRQREAPEGVSGATRAVTTATFHRGSPLAITSSGRPNPEAVACALRQMRFAACSRGAPRERSTPDSRPGPC